MGVFRCRPMYKYMGGRTARDDFYMNATRNETASSSARKVILLKKICKIAVTLGKRKSTNMHFSGRNVNKITQPESYVYWTVHHLDS